MQIKTGACVHIITVISFHNGTGIGWYFLIFIPSVTAVVMLILPTALNFWLKTKCSVTLPSKSNIPKGLNISFHCQFLWILLLTRRMSRRMKSARKKLRLIRLHCEHTVNKSHFNCFFCHIFGIFIFYLIFGFCMQSLQSSG